MDYSNKIKNNLIKVVRHSEVPKLKDVEKVTIKNEKFALLGNYLDKLYFVEESDSFINEIPDDILENKKVTELGLMKISKQGIETFLNEKEKLFKWSNVSHFVVFQTSNVFALRYRKDGKQHYFPSFFTSDKSSEYIANFVREILPSTKVQLDFKYVSFPKAVKAHFKY